MGYRVIQRFVDLQDNNFKYEVGDTFPHLNANISKARIAELASDKNRRGIPLIEEVDDFSKHMNPPEIEEETTVKSETAERPKPKKRKSKQKRKEA